MRDSLSSPLSLVPYERVSDFETEWNRSDVLTLPSDAKSKYTIGFASSDRSVEEVLRLRYEIFNIELGEGLSTLEEEGIDRDEFDEQMTHLILIENSTGRCVGTYRMQTVTHALKHKGIYSAAEYDLATLEPYYGKSVELGRACMASGHRSMRSIMGMWLGIGAFMNIYDQHYLFGCCSLTSQEPDDGWRAMKTIRENDYLHADLYLPPTPEFSCGAAEREHAADIGEALALPKLFQTYMRLGVRVISEPAIDRRFGTVDFLVFMNGHEVSMAHLDVLK